MLLPVAATTTLADGDLVRVPEQLDDGRAVVVEGAVMGPVAHANPEPPALGERPDAPPREVSVRLPFVAGDGVRDLIVKAGGLEPWADPRAAYLRRRSVVNASSLSTRPAILWLGERADLDGARAGDALVISCTRRRNGAGERRRRSGPASIQYSTTS